MSTSSIKAQILFISHRPKRRSFAKHSAAHRIEVTANDNAYRSHPPLPQTICMLAQYQQVDMFQSEGWKIMKRMLKRAGLMVAGLGIAAAAQAGEGDWLVRVRATYLDYHNGQNSLPVNVEARNLWIPEVDFTYYLTDKVSTELVLTYPQKVDINVNGADAGSVKALPPTLLVQYHFGAADAAFSPYVGAGLNLTLFSSRSVLGGGAHISKSSVGPAAQLGADYALSGAWSLNVDLKYIAMKTDVYVGSTKAGKLDLDPWVASIGIGYRF